MTPKQRQRLEALVADSGDDGRHVSIPVAMLAQLLNEAKPKPPRKPKPDADKTPAS